jgi:hypothetical protein
MDMGKTTSRNRYDSRGQLDMSGDFPALAEHTLTGPKQNIFVHSSPDKPGRHQPPRGTAARMTKGVYGVKHLLTKSGRHKRPENAKGSVTIKKAGTEGYRRDH